MRGRATAAQDASRNRPPGCRAGWKDDFPVTSGNLSAARGIFVARWRIESNEAPLPRRSPRTVASYYDIIDPMPLE